MNLGLGLDTARETLEVLCFFLTVTVITGRNRNLKKLNEYFIIICFTDMYRLELPVLGLWWTVALSLADSPGCLMMCYSGSEKSR